MEAELTGLLKLIEDMPAYQDMLADLRRRGSGVAVAVLEAARPYLLTALYRTLDVPMLVVTAQPENSHKLYEQISAWGGADAFRLFPEPDALPYQRIATDASTELERLHALSALAGLDAGQAPLVVTSAPALMQKVPPHSRFTATFHTITLGMKMSPLELFRRWEAMGYRAESVVEMPGTMSHRGGIVDVYPPTSRLPVRLEFFGDIIDSIRLFDPASQRSQAAVPGIAIGPADELLFDPRELEPVLRRLGLASLDPDARGRFEEDLARLRDGQKPPEVQSYASLFNNDSLLSYLPADGLLVLDEPAGIEQSVTDLDAEAEELRLEKTGRGELPPGFPRPYFTWPELEPVLRERRSLFLTSWRVYDREGRHLGFAPAASYAGQLPAFLKKVKQLLGQRHRVVVVSHQASRLSELLGQEDIIAPVQSQLRETPPAASLTLVHGYLAEGWMMGGVHLFTDSEVFGFVKQRRVLRKRPVPLHRLTIEYEPGDFVVHVEHGIGRFAGVTTMKNGAEREYLVLQYGGGDKLYVPTDQIDRVSRYVGGGDEPPTLNRLGTQEWSRSKASAKEAAEEVAQELLALYAAREVMPGIAFSRDTVWQQELESSFAYVETADQVEAIREVKEDMEKPRPMDRLVCGDVGYGKTEVAVRAAFKAVMDGRQVAVLVPTTVLAEQHFFTFKERLDAFPVKIEVLSRFRTPKEQQAILAGLASGGVDIIIGTHRLLQKDVVFKDLGLLVIDEEQRFGVAHKEHLKRLRQEVDVLTLSATPIPRTLHMALAGVRDMSTMQTPPEDRLPVKTYVAPYSDRLVREAILRELERNGQVFFVHNRVQSIGLVAQKLGALVPEARVAVGHGQMPEAELEKVMADFTRGEADVLVCTTIIESGLDMPNANTLIVNNADGLGLTQLYQLRGRVGRGANLAYAYFLYEGKKRLSPIAEKRLKTIFEATELGAGFTIAMRDLEIRGAGTLLGARQSGHISAVGFNLYMKLLGEAVEELKAKRAGRALPVELRLPPPTIDLPLAAYIPEDYVSDLDMRLELYQRLVKPEAAGQLDAFAAEFADRFGPVPPEVTSLLYVIKVRALAAKAGIASISTEDGQVVLRRFEGLRFDRQKLAPLARSGVVVTPLHITLNPKRLGVGWRTTLEEVLYGVG